MTNEKTESSRRKGQKRKCAQPVKIKQSLTNKSMKEKSRSESNEVREVKDLENKKHVQGIKIDTKGERIFKTTIEESLSKNETKAKNDDRNCSQNETTQTNITSRRGKRVKNNTKRNVKNETNNKNTACLRSDNDHINPKAVSLVETELAHLDSECILTSNTEDSSETDFMLKIEKPQPGEEKIDNLTPKGKPETTFCPETQSLVYAPDQKTEQETMSMQKNKNSQDCSSWLGMDNFVNPCIKKQHIQDDFKTDSYQRSDNYYDDLLQDTKDVNPVPRTLRIRKRKLRDLSKGQYKRRLIANARERNRVHTLGKAFEDLRRAVPSYSEDQKLSKLTILKLAISYISALDNLLHYNDSSQARFLFAANVQECTAALQTEYGRAKRKFKMESNCERRQLQSNSNDDL